jgi:phosphomannomutase
MVSPRAFRDYDIRGIVPELVDERSIYYGKLDDPNAYQAPIATEDVYKIGQGLAEFFGAEKIIVGHDARLSASDWTQSLTDGITTQGVGVIQIGMTSTDMVYYAAGAHKLPAVEITASHLTWELNGMKMVGPSVSVVCKGEGMEELRDIVLADNFKPAAAKGTVEQKDITGEYTDHVCRFADLAKLKPVKIVADAGNGVGGVVADRIAARFPQIELDRLYFEPDGNFPNHDANPSLLENYKLLMERIPESGADFGIAWDGDADRVAFFDECGHFVPGDFATAIMARHFLQEHPGEAIINDVRSSWVVRDWVKKLGGTLWTQRVGHSFMKHIMREKNAIFGGEVSGHYYFRDNFYADSGMIAWMVLMMMLSNQDVKMSKLVSDLGPYFVSGEINSDVPSVERAIERIARRYADANNISRLDGISIEYDDWHFNVRPSANDPVLRLNLEALDRAKMEQKTDEVLGVIRQPERKASSAAGG